MDFKQRSPHIFIIGGRLRVGKDTVAGIISHFFNSINKKSIKLQYSSKLKEYVKNISGWDGSEESKPRELLQFLGTEIRNKVDELLFINNIINDIKVYSHFYDVIIISDARVVKELEIPKNFFDKVYTINVTRDVSGLNLSEKEKNHKLERELDNYNRFDFIVENSGTIDELKEKVTKVLEELVQ